MIGWWQEWQALGVLPFGGSDILEQPAYVAQAIAHCQQVADEYRRQLSDKQSSKQVTGPPGPPRGVLHGS